MSYNTEANKTTEVNQSNYFVASKGNFEGVSLEFTIAVMSAYGEYREEGNSVSGGFIKVFGEKYSVNFESQIIGKGNKSIRVPRSNAFYFVSEDGKTLIRIADHWSETKYKGVQKMNCKNIKNCYWTCMDGVAISLRIPGYSSFINFMCGIVKFEDLVTI